MNQTDLTKALAERTDLSMAKTKDVIAALAAIITEGLKNGENVTLHVSLGHFEVDNVPERKGVNPQNRESLIIPAHIKPSFKVSKTLKDALN